MTAATLLVVDASAASAAAPVSLGTAGNFSVLAGATVTNTGETVLAQGLGIHPGNAATGFPPGAVGGQIHLGDAVAMQAKSDLSAAFDDAATRTPFTSLAAELGGTTLTPGVYRIGAAQESHEIDRMRAMLAGETERDLRIEAPVDVGIRSAAGDGQAP